MCTAFNKPCTKCKRNGHFAKMCRNKKKYEKIERMYYKKAQILKMVNTYLLSVPEKSKTGPKKYKLAM